MLSTSSSVSSFSYKPKLANLTAINHSQFSILNAMDRFVNSVEKMQATILVPSRLKDLHLDNEQITLLGQQDAYSLYMMLDEIKRELLWGQSTGATQVAMESLSSNFSSLALTSPSSELSSTPKESSPLIQRHKHELIKCDSSASITFCDPIKRLKKESTFSSDDGFSSNEGSSSNTSSLALSDDESSETEDSESGLQLNTNKNKLESSSVESKDTFHLTAAFRLHLRGLSALCNQLADTAEFITEKYQNELK